MSEPNAPPATVASTDRASRLPRLLLKLAGAEGYASMVNKFGKAQAPGSYSLVDSRRFPAPFQSRTLRVRHDESLVSFTITREPVSCFWLALPFDREDVASRDVWDVLIASDQRAYETQEQALEGTLISLGYLAPWIGSAAAAQRVRALGEQAEAEWLRLWLDPKDLDTRVCNGCHECGWDTTTRVHRIELAEEIG